MKYIPIILFILVLTGPLLIWHRLTRAMNLRQHENAERLVVVTPHNDDIRREFGRAFDQWHQRKYGTSVVIDWRVPGGSTDIRRMLEAAYQPYRVNGKLPPDTNVGLDVIFGGGDFFFDVELKPLGVLEPMHIDPALLKAAFPDPTLAGVKLYDLTR